MKEKDPTEDVNKEENKPIEKAVEEGPFSDQENAESENTFITEEAPAEAKEADEKNSLLGKINELNDKYLRLYSDFENYRKRTTKERIELFKSAGADVLQTMLPVMDDFERAMKSADSWKDVKSVIEGISLVHQKFDKILQQNGVKAMESSVGKDFDINFHEAISSIPAPEAGLKGKIIDEVERGYMLNDKVIRFAKVVIGE